MRFVAFLTLLAGLSGFISAHPHDNDGKLQSPNLEIVPELSETFPERRDLEPQARKLTLRVGEKPKKDSVCPRSNNGPGRDYPEHRFTSNQIMTAFMAGARSAAAGKQIGDGRYPHDFNNREGIRFPCKGSSKMEFPILRNNDEYKGGPVTDVPDRVVFSYKVSKKFLDVEYCGVMRHGPQNFILCPRN